MSLNENELFADLDFEVIPDTEVFNPSPVETVPVGGPDTNEKTEPYLIVELDDVKRIIKESSPAIEPARNVVNLRAKIAETEETIKPQEDRIKSIDEEMRAVRETMEAQLNKLAAEREQIRIEIFDTRKELRRMNMEYEGALNNLRRALDAEKLSKEFAEKSSELDELIVNMPWRDKAFPHQIEGAKQLAMAGRAILGDKMGLGKSLTSLATADMLMVDRLLIIVPDDIVGNFVNEVAHWAPHREVIMLGKMSKAMRNQMFSLLGMMDKYTVVINYSAWRRDTSLIEKLISMRFQMVIMDEAHTIKETSTNAYRGCRDIIMATNSCPECGGEVRQYKVFSDQLTDKDGRNIYTGRREFWKCTSRYVECGWDEVDDVKNYVKRDFGAMRSAKYVFPMTGTVILNKPTDIYALLSLIQPEVYDNKNQFVRDFCQTDYDGKIYFKPGGMDRLTGKLAGRYIARDRNSAGVVLPKQEVIYHNIEMDKELYPKQYSVIEQLTKHAMVMLEDGRQMPIFAVIALITRKRQANVWPAGITLKDEEGNVVFSVGDDVRESIKLDKLIDHNNDGLIPDLTAEGNMGLGERVVVFSQFKGPLRELERRLTNAGISVARFDGDTPEAQRNIIRKDFDRKFCDEEGYEKKFQVVLCNYRTGGVGLNFTGATQMIILDEEWSPGKANQAYGRVDRMGQTEETTVHVLQLERTIDDWMRALNENKQAMVDGFEESANLQGMLAESFRKGEML